MLRVAVFVTASLRALTFAMSMPMRPSIVTPYSAARAASPRSPLIGTAMNRTTAAPSALREYGKGRDGPATPRSAAPNPTAVPRPGPLAAVTVAEGDGGGSRAVVLSHPEKVLYPEDGFTKADVAGYYRAVAPRLLPFLRDRPVTLERLPDGLGAGKSHFWQKNTPAAYPDWLPRVEVETVHGKPVRYALVNDAPALLYLVNQGALTFHPWLSRIGALDRPDFVLFDLDPGQAPFADVVAVARAVHKELERDGREAVVKTSGKTGLHVLVPWRDGGGYDDARAWAREVAGRVCAARPDVAEEIGKAILPFSVDLGAEEIALAALARREEVRERCRGIALERERVASALRALGANVAPSRANFLFLVPPGGDGARVFRDLRARGVLVRDQTSVVPGALRVTVGTREENDLFLSTLKEVL